MIYLASTYSIQYPNRIYPTMNFIAKLVLVIVSMNILYYTRVIPATSFLNLSHKMFATKISNVPNQYFFHHEPSTINTPKDLLPRCFTP
jgi:25S rRNA (uracil2843-N3)-methyltransferase